MGRQDVNDTLREEGPEGVRARSDKAKKYSGGGGWNGARTYRFKLTRLKDIELDMKANYVIKGLIPANALVVIWGPPKCGKSFTAFDMVMHPAVGLDYRGMAVQQGAVVYCALEGGGGFPRRVVAWARDHASDLEGKDPPFYLMNLPIALVADQNELIQDIIGQIEEPLAVVVIDTLNRALGDLDEDTAGMAKLIKAADAVRTHLKCAVVIVHHCGLDASRPRGPTSLRGAVDALIAVSKDDFGVVTVTPQEMRDDEPPPPFCLRLEPVEIGRDDEGATRRSLVVRPVETTRAQHKAQQKINDDQRRFLDILAEAVGDVPPEHSTRTNIPGGRLAVTRMWLKTCCHSKGWIDPEDAANQQRALFSRMLKALSGKRLIGMTDKYVWDART